MNQQPQINIHVTINQTSDEQYRDERRIGGMQVLASYVQKCISHRIATEQAKGNPHFAHIETHEQYMKACRLEELDQRKRDGIGAQIAGAISDMIYGE